WMYFDTGNNRFYYDDEDAPQLQQNGNQTIEVWVKPERFNTRRNIYGVAYAGEGAITLEEDGSLTYFYGILGTNSGTGGVDYDHIKSNYKLKRGVWQHIAIVRDFDTGKLRWYINGELTNEKDTLFDYAQPGTQHRHIGYGYTGNYYNGGMDEFRIWDEALTQEKIKARMDTTLRGDEAALLLYNTFDDGTGTDYSSYHSEFMIYGDPVTIEPADGSPSPVGRDVIVKEEYEYCTDPDSLEKKVKKVTATETIVVPEREDPYQPPSMDHLQFNAENDYIDCQNILSGAVDFSVGMWVNTTQDEGDSDWDQSPAIIGTYQTNYGDSNDFLLLNRYGEIGWFDEFGGSDNTIDTNTFINDGKWHHIAAVREGTAVTLYLDGYKIGEATTGTDSVNAEDIVMGWSQYKTYTSTKDYNGAIDEVVIYDRALTWQEVQALRTGVNTTDANLVAYYPMDDGTATDMSGNGNDGTLQGSTPPAPAQIAEITEPGAGLIPPSNRHMSFDGDDYIKIPDNDSFNTSELAIGAWVKWEGGPLGDNYAIVSGYSGGGTYDHYGLRMGPGGKAVFYYDDGSAWDQVVGTSKINDGNWHYIMGTLTPGVEAKVYVDGVLENTDMTSIPDTFEPSNNMYIGRDGEAAAESNWKGAIDEVAILRQILTDTQVADIMAGALDKSGLNMIADYTFDDGTATDLSGNGNNGDIYGAQQSLIENIANCTYDVTDGKVTGIEDTSGEILEYEYLDFTGGERMDRVLDLNGTLLVVEEDTEGAQPVYSFSIADGTVVASGGIGDTVNIAGFDLEIRGTELADINLREIEIRGMDFDSEDNYMYCLNASGIPTGSDPYTMMCWINPRQHDYREIMGWGSFYSSSRLNYIRLENEDEIRIWWDSDDYEVETGNLTGAWHHVALTYDGSSARLYVDGVYKGGKDDTTHYTDNTDVYIGTRYNNDGDRFDGGIDEVAVFDRALSDTELQQAMDRITGDESGLVLWYPMDQDTITGDGRALDMSGMGNDATIAGNLRWKGSVVQEILAPVMKIGDELRVLSDAEAKKSVRREYRTGQIDIELTGSTYNQANFNIYEAVDGIKTGSGNGWAVSGGQGEEGMFVTGLSEADEVVITSGVDRPAHNPIDIEVYYTVDETPSLRQSVWMPVTNIDVVNLDSGYFAEGNRVMVNGLDEVDIYDLIFDRVKMTAIKIKINDSNAADHNFVLTEVEILGREIKDVPAGTSEFSPGSEYSEPAQTIPAEDVYATAMGQDEVFEFVLDITKDEMEADIPAQEMGIMPFSIAGTLEGVDTSSGKIKILGYEVVPPAEIYLDGEEVTLSELKTALDSSLVSDGLIRTISGCNLVNTPDEGWKITSQKIRFYSSGGLKYVLKGDLEAIDYVNGTITVGGRVIQLWDTDPSAEGFTLSGGADFYVQPYETLAEGFEQTDLIDAMKFDGADDHISYSYTTALDIADEMTIAAWFKLDSVAGSHTIMTKDFGSGGTQLGFRIQDGRLDGGISDTDYDFWVNNIGQFIPDQWYHVAMTYSESQNKYNVYSNGELIGSGNLGSCTHTESTGSLTVGMDNRSTNYLDGQIDEVTIMNQALTAEEVKAIMESPQTAASYTTTALYCSFDGRDATDASGNAINGTITGAKLGSRTKALQEIVDRSYLHFDGTGTVDFDDKFIFHEDTDATMSFWMKPERDSVHETMFWGRTDGTDSDRFNIIYHSDGNLMFDYRSSDGTLHS
ncbi:MAG: hypothetical protein GF414_04325, partial [Candidatus Altiarchaeales archaeon]|nr:hypothetical protein [Candidatus Altiarchaeales archaeon]